MDNTYQKLKEYSEQYRKELEENVLPFWIKHSQDTKYGGFFTCLDQTGNVFDTDKFMWLQGREVWCFSFMYKNLQQNPEYLQMALKGAEYMQKYGRDAEGNWYFSLNQEGQPLIQPYNIFSDCFACMAFAALYKIQPNEEYKKIAVDTFENILKRKDNWKGSYSKAFPGTRSLRNFSLPMILCNLSLELEEILGSKRVEEFIPIIIDEVMNVHYSKEFGLMLENINQDGSFSDSFEGRVQNPGHAIEAMWFIMDLGKRLNDQKLIEEANRIMLHTLEQGWDKKYGGIFYFLDLKNYPTQQLEWDQKLWWVHVETLVALIKGYQYTKNEKNLEWFHKIHDYSWKHFKDPNYSEWFGYLNRQGEVLLNLKGGKWKGCFHVPRALYQVHKSLCAIIAETEQSEKQQN